MSLYEQAVRKKYPESVSLDTKWGWVIVETPRANLKVVRVENSGFGQTEEAAWRLASESIAV